MAFFFFFFPSSSNLSRKKYTTHKIILLPIRPIWDIDRDTFQCKVAHLMREKKKTEERQKNKKKKAQMLKIVVAGKTTSLLSGITEGRGRGKQPTEQEKTSS